MKPFRHKILSIFSIIVSLSFSFPAVAAEKQQVYYLIKDDPAPYDGVLFPMKDAIELRKSLIEAEALKAVNESYEKSIQLYKKNEQLTDQKYNTLLDQNDRLSTALVESRRSNDLQKILWFGLGVLATGFAVYGAKKITQ